MRRIISGSGREIFPRILWTGERCTSSLRMDNDRVRLCGVTTGVTDSSDTLTLVLIAIWVYKYPENINSSYPQNRGFLKLPKNIQERLYHTARTPNPGSPCTSPALTSRPENSPETNRIGCSYPGMQKHQPGMIGCKPGRISFRV